MKNNRKPPIPLMLISAAIKDKALVCAAAELRNCPVSPGSHWPDFFSVVLHIFLIFLFNRCTFSIFTFPVHQGNIC